MADDYYRVLVLVGSHGGPYAAIFDLSGVTSTMLSPDAVRGLARRAPAIPAGRPRVIVAEETWIFGMARMFQICRDFPGRTISCRPVIEGRLRYAWHACRRLYAARFSERTGRMSRIAEFPASHARDSRPQVASWIRREECATVMHRGGAPPNQFGLRSDHCAD